MGRFAPGAARVARRALKFLGFLLLGLVALVITAVLCANLPPARAFIVARANSALRDTFAGRLEIERLGAVSFRGVRGVDGRLFDPAGRKIAEVRGLHAELDWPRLGWALVVEEADPLVVRIRSIELDHADVRLADDGTGTPTLARTFEPRTPEPTERKTFVQIDSIRLRHVWVHGKLGTLPPLDAELSGAEGSFQMDDRVTAAELARLRFVARGLPRGIDPQGELSGSLRLPEDSAALKVSGRFEGSVARATTRVSLELEGPRVAASVGIRAPPQTLRLLSPDLGARGTTEIELEARGTRERLAFELAVSNPAGRAGARGHAVLGEAVTLYVKAEARSVDLSGFRSSAPVSELGLDLDAHATLQGESLSGAYQVTTLPSFVAGQELPVLVTAGTFDRGAAGLLFLAGTFTILERGAPTTGKYALSSQEESVLEIDLETRLDAPARLVASAGKDLEGTIESQLRFELERQKLDGRATLDLRKLESSGASIGRLRAAAMFSGTLPAIAYAMQGDAEDVGVAGQHLTRVRVQANGSPERAHVSATLAGEAQRTAALSADLVLVPKLELRNTELAVAQVADQLVMRVGKVELGDRVRVQGFEIEGAGSARGSVAFGKELESLEVVTRDLDLWRVTRLLGFDSKLAGGRVTLDAKYTRKRGEPDATVEGRVTGLSYGRLRCASLELHGTLVERKLDGNIEADLGVGEKVTIALEGVALTELGLDANALGSLSGKATVSGSFDLNQMADLLDLERARGKVHVDALVERSDVADTLPDVQVEVRTEGLDFLTKRPADVSLQTQRDARAAAPRGNAGMDIEGSLSIQAQNGKTSLRARSFDKKGDFARLELETTLPRKLSEALNPSLDELPVSGKLEAPERRLANLPDLLRLPGVQGSGTVRCTVQGTAGSPEIELFGRFSGVRPIRSQAKPLDAEFRTRFSRESGEVGLSVHDEKKQVATVEARWQGDLLLVPEALDGESPIQGSASLSFDHFPIKAFPGAVRHSVTGVLFGKLDLTDLGTTPRLQGQLWTGDLKIDRAELERVALRVRAVGDELALRAEVKQQHGSLESSLRYRLDWQRRLIPRLERARAFELDAKDFELEPMGALTPRVTELGGLLNAHIRASFEQDAPLFEGLAKIHHGTVQPRELGQRFHDIDAELHVEPGRLHLTHLHARGSTGKLSMTGKAELDGLALTSAQADLKIAKNEKVPVIYEGVVLGDAWGHVAGSYRASEQASEFKVSVPELHFELPEASAHRLQELEPAADVRIGTHRQDGVFVLLPLQPLKPERSPDEAPMVFQIDLGEIQIQRGTMLDARLTGELRVELAEEVTIDGEIRTRRGKLDIQGRLFDIERASVNFTGEDPSNPTITALARWDAPGEYRVYAEYTGTTDEGRLTLSSEPSLTQNEILSLLLFGSPEGTIGTSSGGTSAAAAAFGLAGGTAVKGVNRVLSRVSSLDVDARVDTSTGAARPELVLQLTPRLSARVSYTLGEPTPGQPPDRTFATLDLRIGGRWSLATTVGDKGASAFDMIWRHRY